MAVPTISAVTPPSGHTGGRNLVEITGTGFKLWTIPPPGPGIEPPPTPTVEVLFGGEEGTEVAVISATRLLVRVPSSPIPVATPAYGAGAVSIIVRNLDALGVPIPGETVTQPAAYTYDRVQLAAESDLQRLCRTLIQELKKQVITEVAISVHTDWDPDPADLENVVGLASLPGIAIFGPNLVPNRTYSKNGITYRPTVGVESNVRRSPGTDDVTFSITGVSEIKAEAINLLAEVRGFFENNRWIQMLAVPSDVAQGYVRYELHLDPAGLRWEPSDGKSNLRSFSGNFLLRGFDIEDPTGYPQAHVVGKVAQATEGNVVVVQQMEES